MVSFSGMDDSLFIQEIEIKVFFFSPFHESITGLPLYNIFKLMAVAIGLRISLH
jgi:hypothetical protein